LYFNIFCLSSYIIKIKDLYVKVETTDVKH